MTHQKQFWRSFVPKLESGRKLTSTSCRASSSLSNCLCQYFYEFWPPARLFRILYITSTLHKTLVGPIKAVKIVLILMDSDTVFHEESEYGVGFKIWAKKVGLSSIFRKQFIFFCWKNWKCIFCILPISLRKKIYFKKVYYQNDQRKILYKPWKFQQIWTWSPDRLANSGGMTLLLLNLWLVSLEIIEIIRMVNWKWNSYGWSSSIL